MKASSLRDAVQVMRAAAAYSTALKNMSDIIRRSLRLEDRDEGGDELSELVVCELTISEIEKLRQKDEEDYQPAPEREDDEVDEDDVVDEGAA